MLSNLLTRWVATKNILEVDDCTRKLCLSVLSTVHYKILRNGRKFVVNNVCKYAPMYFGLTLSNDKVRTKSYASRLDQSPCVLPHFCTICKSVASSDGRLKIIFVANCPRIEYGTVP